jgi:hypothetical protein
MKILKSESSVITDLLFLAKKEIAVSLPNINSVLAKTLIALHERDIKVTVFLELNEMSYRQGYGEIGALEEIRNKGIVIKDRKNINLFFYLIDDSGYFNFPKSSFHEAEGVAYDLCPMTHEQVCSVKFLFGLLEMDAKIPDAVNESYDSDTHKRIAQNISIPDKENVDSLVQKVKRDPPVKPNLMRILETYVSKIQFVDIKFRGSNLHIKKIKLPKDIIPFKDAKLKKSLESSIRLFVDIPEKDFFKPFFIIKEDFEIVKAEYITYLQTREKNIILRDKKKEFMGEVDSLKKEVENVKRGLINKLQQEINDSRNRLRNDLTEFLIQNPGTLYVDYEMDIRKQQLVNHAIKLVARVNFPEAKQLLDEIKIEVFYYDITWEDLNNKEVLEEMVKKGLISNKERAHVAETVVGGSRSR